MATYQELFDLAQSNVLIDRVSVALTIKADTILNAGAPTQPQIDWAKSALRDPGLQAKTFLYAVLAANKDATVTQIQSATDTAIQTNVDAAVDKLFGV